MKERKRAVHNAIEENNAKNKTLYVNPKGNNNNDVLHLKMSSYYVTNSGFKVTTPFTYQSNATYAPIRTF